MRPNRAPSDRVQSNLPVPGTNEILVLPLGGTDRVGMNATLVGYNGRWLMIDAGATFPGADDERAAAMGEALGGEVNQIIPDLRVIRSILGRLDGIVFTHAHEDHIGALPAFYSYLKAWPELSRVPLYATDYTRGIIRRKLDELGCRPRIHRIESRKSVRIGSLEVVPISVTHSAPQTCMLAIRSKVGTIVFGSDAKLDPRPLLGRRTDVRALETLGQMGVAAFFADSTNAVHAGRSVSEAEVSSGLTNIMRQHSGRVIVSTFASNLARVVGVAEAAKAAGRNLGAAGRTIFNNIETATQCGVLKAGQVSFLENRYLNEQPAEFTAVVCTGTQAEQGSALRRAAEDLDMGRRGRGLLIEPGDLVVHSARTIPGNEHTVEAMFQMLRDAGVKVIDPTSTKEIVHASGHAKRDELIDFYRMLRPRFAAPVHGDRRLIEAHLDLARSEGKVQEAISPREGEILAVSDAGMRLVGRIAVGQLAVLTLGSRYSGETRLVSWNAAPIDMRYQSPENFGRRRENRYREPAAQLAGVPSVA